MIIDIIVVVLVIWGIIKGFQKGLIVAIFSILAMIIGLAAAMKLSAVVAEHLDKSVKVSQQWLPIISFAIVFIGVILLVRLGGLFLQRLVDRAFLGSVNRIGGALLYSALYIFIFSVILFYADQMNIIKPATKQASVTYEYVGTLGPKVIDGVGKMIPLFKGMFSELRDFFGGISN